MYAYVSSFCTNWFRGHNYIYIYDASLSFPEAYLGGRDNRKVSSFLKRYWIAQNVDKFECFDSKGAYFEKKEKMSADDRFILKKSLAPSPNWNNPNPVHASDRFTELSSVQFSLLFEWHNQN